MNKFYKKAFTLAEVLITLGIIGIVAAMTIPTLIQNYQKQQTVSKLEKAYSVIMQAIKLSEADNGPISTWTFGHSGVTNTYQAFDTYFAPYLKINKYCYAYTDCNYTPGFNYINGVGEWGFGGANDRLGVILQDGTLFHILDKTGWTSALIHIDINGSLPPDRDGKDVFVFSMDNNIGFIPAAYPTNDCSSVGTTGYGCASKIIQDGWQIKSDYPW